MIAKLVKEDVFSNNTDWINQDLLENELVNALSEIFGTEDVVLIDANKADYNIDGRLYSLGSNFVLGTDMDDGLEGSSKDDQLYGNEGDDTIVSNSGVNSISGNEGDDTILVTSDGINTIHYNLGDGLDTIISRRGDNENAIDQIVFGEGITQEDLSFSQDGDSMIVTINDDPAQGMRINTAFVPFSELTKISSFEFADGTSLSFADAKELALNDYIEGTNEADNIVSEYGDDIISGLAGDDVLSDEWGDNTFIGGQGNDTIISGGSGNNTIKYNLGDGFDVINSQKWGENGLVDDIVFGEGITKENIDFSLDESDYSILVTINNDHNQGMKIKNIFRGDHVVNTSFKFADGSSIDSENLYDTISGLAGDDQLIGAIGDNTLIGGNGNDTIVSGGKGNNTIKYNLGDGFDVINSQKRGEGLVDDIVFGEGITKDNINISLDQSDYSIVVNVNGDPNQGMRIRNVFRGDRIINTGFKFADGTAIASNEVYDMVFGKNILGTQESEYLGGSYNDDIINAKEGSDIIVGRSGDDTITTSGSENTIKYNLGDGFDSISSLGENYTDKIVFGEGISKEDLSYKQDGNDLVINVKGDDTQGFRLVDFGVEQGSNIGSFEFTDGSSLDIDDLYELGLYNKDLQGTANNDTLEGDFANDTISAGDGNDILDGKSGADTLEGGYGDDTYIFNRGSGVDTIIENPAKTYTTGFWFWEKTHTVKENDTVKFGEGLDYQDMRFDYEGNDLHVTFTGSEDDKLIIKDFEQGTLSKFEFADGKIFELSDIRIGTESDNSLNGNANDNLMMGNEGNDTLEGSYGNDTYTFNKGSGVDTVVEKPAKTYTTGFWFWEKTHTVQEDDTIEFGEGLNQEDMHARYSGNDLHITFAGAEGDKLILQNYDNSTISKFEFSDGAVLDSSDIRIGGSVWDRIRGNDRDNILIGNEGDDTIIGGQGDDVLAGGVGSDTYEYSSGDGNDTINLAGDGSTDTLKLNDISKDDILFSRSDNDLQINFHDQLSSLIVDDYFESQYNNDSLIIDTNDEFQMQLAANANKMAEILAVNTSSDEDIDGGSVNGSNQVTTQVDASQLADLWVPKEEASS